MEMKNGEFTRKLLATFRVEAEEHLQAISSGLLQVEKAVSEDRRRQVVENIFREAHSLKGAARAVNLTVIESVCQPLESVFSALKQRAASLLPTELDILHDAVEILGHLIRSAERQERNEAQGRLPRLLEGLEKIRQGGLLPARGDVSGVKSEGSPDTATDRSSYASEKEPSIAGTVRIPTARLDSLFLQAQELLAAGLNARQQAVVWSEMLADVMATRRRFRELHPDLQGLARNLEAAANPQTGVRRAYPGHRLLEFLDGQGDFLKSLEFRLRTAAKTAEFNQEQLNAAVSVLLEESKQTLILPCWGLLKPFPPLVRRLAREHAKEVELVVRGGEIEIDKRILEELKDPLIHIVRNCIDHGIETPELRRQAKKLPLGIITIALAQSNGNIELAISDDGGGIDLQKVRAAAVRAGLASPEEAGQWDDGRALTMVFESGVSTSPMITDLSGRGLGLAIVREKVENLGGVASLESCPRVGTTLRLILPVTLATFRGVLVRVAERPFVIPTAHVERVMRIDRKEIKTVENRETIPLNGLALSLVRLGEALELPLKSSQEAEGEHVIVVLLRSGEKRVAFAVDEVLAEQKVLVKGLGKQLARVRNVTGATVVGAGRVVPILNVVDLMKSAVKIRSPISHGPVAGETPVRRSILVAEDSITARTLLKNILESAGYDVRTAVDGAEALALLRSEEFDLLISDVDMPRMSGFELTAKVRGDKNIQELPVILVTALESREDRERGIDVGASAYIVKSSFDQSNLLSVMSRLI